MNRIRDDKGFVFIADGDHLTVRKDDRELVRLDVRPVVDGKSTSLGPWHALGKDHIVADITDHDAAAHVQLDHGYVCYYLETSVRHFKTLHYFTSGQADGDGWQTYMSDVHDCFRSYDLDAEVAISSCFDGVGPGEPDGAGMTDPGDVPPTWIWNVPIRAMALHTACGFIGLSMPGPLPVGLTRAVVEDGRFSLLFEELRPACDEGMMPRVYFATGLEGAYDALEKHRDLSKSLGWMVDRLDDHPKWWSWPTYKPSIDHQIEMQNRGQLGFRFFEDKDGKQVSLLTTQWLVEQTDRWLKECRLTQGTRVHLDQMYMYGYGSKRILRELGGAEGFRSLIDEWRRRHIYVGPYFNPFVVGTDEPFYREHPECFCKPIDYSPRFVAPNAEELRPERIDWTHPLARQRQLEYLEFLLSDKPGCLNCDWLGINNTTGTDPAKYEVHDPDWAIGDLLQYKVHKLVYEKVKQIKPEAMVRRIAGGACYLQPFIDQIQLIEHWRSDTDDYYKRGQVLTHTTHHMLIDTDPFYCSQTKGQEFFTGMATWNIPDFGGFTMAMHPYGRYRDLPVKDQRRRIASVQVYMNAPQKRTDTCRVTWDRDRPSAQWRKRADGPLAGWYASLAITPRCFVTYSDSCAMIGASESRTVRIPLPPNATASSVSRVLHAGGQVDHPFELCDTDDGPGVRLKALDCGGETLYTEIRYDLGVRP